MTRFRLAVLVLIGTAFLAAPLSALCSTCCGGDENGLSAPMPCCDGTCGPYWAASRPGDPAVAPPGSKADSLFSIAAVQPQVIERTVVSRFLAATLTGTATESPPVSASVLRL